MSFLRSFEEYGGEGYVCTSIGDLTLILPVAIYGGAVLDQLWNAEKANSASG